MCGIVGILSLNGAAVDPAVLQRMNDRQAHRGPDGEGYLFGWIEDGRPAQAFLRHTAAWDGRAAVRVALGHRRLAILDLSERGIQPMAAGAGGGGGGRVYNGGLQNTRAGPPAVSGGGRTCPTPHAARAALSPRVAG